MKSLISRLRGNAPPSQAPTSRPSSGASGSGGKENAPPSRLISSTSNTSASAGKRLPLLPNNSGPPVVLGDQAGRTQSTMGNGEARDPNSKSSSGVDGNKKVTFRSPAPPVGILENPASLRAPVVRRRESNDTTQSPRPNPPSRSSTALSHASRLSTASASASASSPLSPTPSDGALSNRSYLPPPNSWSEMAEEELIANLGPRERTRQEVLWEIVSSEERYVQELIKLNDTFSSALLPPSARSPSLSLAEYQSYRPRSLSRTLSPNGSIGLSLSPGHYSPGSPTPSLEQALPIAAQYASGNHEFGAGSRSPSGGSTGVEDEGAAARWNAYNILTNGRPSQQTQQLSPAIPNHLHSMGGGEAVANGKTPRSHHSLPPSSQRNGRHTSSSLTRMSMQSGKSAVPAPNITSREISLPEELEKVLGVLSGSILEGHIKLAAALRKRYENQYPLVRSLADVFTAHSYILREYETYVLYLERALSIVDETLSLLPGLGPGSTYSGPGAGGGGGGTTSRRLSKRLDESPVLRLSYLLHSLEELAASRGEAGLVISLSKPFQRFLKYPLLFQNLLFNTDPSLKEYEATLRMVDDVEAIVRNIEDEKASSEEREKTRDVWARLEGLEKDKMLMTPKATRLLVSEEQLPVQQDQKDRAVKQKKSFKRLSDILKHSDPVDLWVVRFTDVSLLCEKTGVTHLPIHRTRTPAAGNGRSESFNDLGGKQRAGTTGRRAQSVRARNLYKFVRVHEWHIQPKAVGSEAMLDMDQISRSREGTAASPNATPRKNCTTTPSAGPAAPLDLTPTKIPLKESDGPSPLSLRESDTMVSDRISVMSFAFKGSDQVRPVHLRIKPPGAAHLSTAAGAGARGGGRDATSTANAKFAHRLRSSEIDTRNSPVPVLVETDAQATLRPRAQGRRSLPPAMIRTPSAGTTGVEAEVERRNASLLNPPRIPSATGGPGGPSRVGGERKMISAVTAKRLSAKAAARAGGRALGERI